MTSLYAPGRPLTTNTRGFNVRLWQAGGLGYALVSGVDGAELARLAARPHGERRREKEARGSCEAEPEGSRRAYSSGPAAEKLQQWALSATC